MKQASSLITQKFDGFCGTDANFHSNRKAVGALFPYAVLLAQDGQQEMLDAISYVALQSASLELAWRHIEPCIVTLFNESSPHTMDGLLHLRRSG